MQSKRPANVAGELLSKAIFSFRAGNLSEAHRLCAAAVAKEKSNVIALHLLAVLEAQKKNTDNALRLFKRALDISPRSADLWADNGRVLTEISRHEDALFCYQKAVTFNPAHGAALQNQGYSLLALGRHADALVIFDRLLTIAPN